MVRKFEGFGFLKMEKVEKIVHVERMIVDFKRQLFNKSFADLVFVIKGFRMPVHTQILASRSEYFRELFYGGQRESPQGEIPLHDVDPLCFKLILNYIYIGLIDLFSVTAEGLRGLHNLARKYGFLELEESINEHMKSILNEGNVCRFYMVAYTADIAELCTACLKFIDRAAKKLLGCDEISDFPAPALRHILLRDTLCVEEIDVFEVVRRWAAKHVESKEIESLLQAVRWDALSQTELMGPVRESKLLHSDLIWDIFASLSQTKDVSRRRRGNLKLDGVDAALVSVGDSGFGGSVAAQEETGPPEFAGEETAKVPAAAPVNNTTELHFDNFALCSFSIGIPGQMTITQKRLPVFRARKSVAGGQQSSRNGLDSAQPSNEGTNNTKRRMGDRKCAPSTVNREIDDDADSDLELVPLRKKARNPSTLRQSAPAAVNHLRKSVDRHSPSISRDASHTEGFDTENLETQSVRVQHQPANDADLKYDAEDIESGPRRSAKPERICAVSRRRASSFVYNPSTSTDPQSTSGDDDPSEMEEDFEADELKILTSRKQQKQRKSVGKLRQGYKRLTDEQIVEMVKLGHAGMKVSDLAKHYECCKRSVQFHIRRRDENGVRLWKMG